MPRARRIRLIVAAPLLVALLAAAASADTWFPGRVNNAPGDISGAEAAVVAAYQQHFGRAPEGGEHMIHVNSVRDNYATLAEVLGNIAAAAGAGAPGTPGTPGAPGAPGTPGAPPPGAFGSESSHAPVDQLDPYFTRSATGRIDEESTQNYACAQDPPGEPSANTAKACAHLTDAIQGTDIEGYNDDGTPRRRGLKLDGSGPMPDITYHWKATDPLDATLGAADGRSFSVRYPDPAEPPPHTSKVACRIRYRYKQFILEPNAGAIAAGQNAFATFPALVAAMVPANAYAINAPPAPTVGTSFAGDPKNSGSFTSFVSYTITYKYKVTETKTVTNPDGTTSEVTEEVEKNGSKSKSWSGQTGLMRHEMSNRTTPEAILLQTVVDITCPKITLLPCGLDVDGNIPATTGDFILVRAKISDNNRFADIRDAWLHYETKPSWGTGIETWAGAPLKLEVDGSKGGVPFTPANVADYRAMTPLPYNVKGHKALRWYVDVRDGSVYSEVCGAFGNHNKGDLAHDGTNLCSDTHNTDYGYISLFDNDRPNIKLTVWEVTRGGIERVGTYEAVEDWAQPDMYNAFGATATWSAPIPTDDDLKAVPPVIAVPPELEPYILEPVRDAMVAKFGEQKSSYEFRIGDRGETLYEDRKYVFIADVDDNVEFLCNNLVLTPVPKLERTRFYYRFREPSERIDMGGEDEVARGGGTWKWYISTADPNDMVAGTGSRDCYAFEHVFHQKIAGADPADACFLELRAVDTAGHERRLSLTIRIGDVKSEFRSFDEKIEREGSGGKR